MSGGAIGHLQRCAPLRLHDADRRRPSWRSIRIFARPRRRAAGRCAERRISGRPALGKKVDLKAFLMDQRIVAGLGNIYVCEALYRARLIPWQAGRAGWRRKTGKPHAARPTSGGGDQGRAQDAIARRRLDAARLQAGGRIARLLPAPIRRLRPRRRALHDARLPGQGAPQNAGRPLDVLLPGVPAMSGSSREVRRWPTATSSSRRRAGSASSRSTGPTRSTRSTAR